MTLRKRNTTKSPTIKPQRQRDHGAEYALRIARGLAAGKSRSASRGHARAGERPKPASPLIVRAKSPEEQAIRMIARGSTLRAAAREYDLREETLRRYLKENVHAERRGRKWEISDDRVRHFPIYSNGSVVSPALTKDQATKAAAYMQSVGMFLSRGKIKVLQPFKGAGVIDIGGRQHIFETDPDALWELDTAGELSFPELYKIVT